MWCWCGPRCTWWCGCSPCCMWWCGCAAARQRLRPTGPRRRGPGDGPSWLAEAAQKQAPAADPALGEARGRLVCRRVPMERAAGRACSRESEREARKRGEERRGEGKRREENRREENREYGGVGGPGRCSQRGGAGPEADDPPAALAPPPRGRVARQRQSPGLRAASACLAGPGPPSRKPLRPPPRLHGGCGSSCEAAEAESSRC